MRGGSIIRRPGECQARLLTGVLPGWTENPGSDNVNQPVMMTPEGMVETAAVLQKRGLSEEKAKEPRSGSLGGLFSIAWTGWVAGTVMDGCISPMLGTETWNVIGPGCSKTARRSGPGLNPDHPRDSGKYVKVVK